VFDLRRFDAVALDIDGTLAGADHLVSGFAAGVVRRLAGSGRQVVISTGRSAANALRVAAQIGANAPVIAANGAVVADTADGRRLRVVAFEPGGAAPYLELADACGLDPVIWTADQMIAAGPGLAVDLLARAGEHPILFQPRSAWPQAGVIKVLMAAAPKVLDGLDLDGYPLIQRSLAHFVEATAPAARKDLALAWLLAHLGIDPARAAVFGDAETDLASLRLAGLGVAPAGAVAAVRAAAGLVIGPHQDDAVAHLLDQALAAL
jgi:hydroxymethylpyrimidine pyrophosphatase-like HAD family hydrolase